MSDPQWYRDLESGSGSAAGLDPVLREAMALSLRDLADEERAAAARSVAQERGQRSRAIASAAFRLLLGRLILGAVIVGLTPVGASFATISPAGPNIKDVVFFAGETGSTAGSGPFTLYSILVQLVLALIVVMLVVDLVLGPPRGAVLNWPAIVGAAAGLAVFIMQWVNDGLTGGSWAFPPAFLAAVYLISALATCARIHPVPAGMTGRQLRDR